MAIRKSDNKPPGKEYSLLADIKSQKYYKSNVQRRDQAVRKLLENKLTQSGPKDAIPGQLISFNYLEPKTKEELQYYDAKPLTIFFGRFKTENGLRIMGFNLHYYPPRIRFQIMDRIMDIWKPMYLDAWETGINRTMMHFDYRWLLWQLQRMGLGFGVRMYIPNLTGNVRVVPPSLWSKAVYTEGEFKKETRNNILNYWKNFQRAEKTIQV